MQQQNLKPINSTPQPFKSRIDQILPKETSVKMLVVKERIKNIHFMASLLESELQMIEKSTFQDLDLLQSRILMLNYLIVEESLYIKAALSVLPVSPFDIDHDLIELSKTVGYLNKFDEKEITFLKKFKETFHFMRYGNSSKSNGQVAKTTKKAKTSAKNNQPIPLASPEEGFTPVLNKQSADAGESISNYISSQTDLMESILKKLFA
jgi:hypothetical protein